MTRGLALCAGVGGLELGISAALPGYRAACYVENEAYAAAVLAQRMEAGDLPPAAIYSDLRTFDPRPWRGVVGLVSAGYPCQPFSVAGTRKGKDDPRHLWPHVMRVVREVGPRVVCLENVRGHLSLGFAQVLGDLADAGFSVEWGVFSADSPEVGAPHRRERLFILAHAKREPGRQGGAGDPKQRPRGRHTGGGRGRADKVAHADSGRRQKQRERGLQHEERQAFGDDTDRRRGALSAKQQHPAQSAGWWEIEPGMGRVVNGAPYRVDRLRALGNAVVPAQAAHAFRVLAWRAGL